MAFFRFSTVIESPAYWCAVVLVSVLSMGLWTEASAQSLTPQQSPAQPSATDVVTRALKIYHSLSSYQDSMRYVFALRGQMGGAPVSEDLTQVAELKFAAPAQIALTKVPIELWTNGRHLWLRDLEQKQYIQRAIGPSQKWYQVADDFASLNRSHPVLEILSGECQSKTGFPGLDELTGVSTETLNGDPVMLVQGFGAVPDMPPEIGVKIFTKAWFSSSSGLLVKMQTDLRSLLKKNYENAPANMQLHAETALITIELTEIQLNKAIDAQTFVFSPAADETKVERFTIPGDREISGPALINEQAPPFSGTLLGGGEVSLKELAGKIIILNFWSVSCQPCLQNLKALEEMNTELKSKGVVVLGVNQDESAKSERVGKVVRDQQVTFRHLLDPGGTTGRSFGVTAVPMTFVIDAEGFVRLVVDGNQEQGTERIHAKIKELVKADTQP